MHIVVRRRECYPSLNLAHPNDATEDYTLVPFVYLPPPEGLPTE